MAEGQKKRIVRMTKRNYSYEDMRENIWELRQRYRDIIDVRILERTADQRNIYCICLGNPVAKQSIVTDAALHGREWLNTQLIMGILEFYCENYYRGKYQGRYYRDLFDEVCVYLLPMMNPDGVTISQFGAEKIHNEDLSRLVRQLGQGKEAVWKSNARGVDLNRNYDSRFDENPVKIPSHEEYGGEYPLSEPESRALVRLIKKVNASAVINYHETGPLIYYTKSSSLLKTAHRVTRYPMVKEEMGSPGCLGDWLEREGISYCTLETCRGKAPVGHWQIYPAYFRNRNLLAALAKEIYE